MKNWLACFLVAVGLVNTPLFAEAAVHRKACETPYQGVSVCWEAMGDEELEISRFNKLHLLPIARQIAGQPEVLVDMSRAIFRQLLPGRLAEQLIPEWTPAYYLEGALQASQNSDWPAVLWISPREMRNSSSTSDGILDWDVYLLAKGQLLRTLRIRVESNPKQTSDGLERSSFLGAALFATGALKSAPIGSLEAMSLAYGMGQSNPPEAGQPLDLLTELATRQILFLFQQPLDTLPAPKSEVSGNSWSANNVINAMERPFTTK